MQYQTLRPNSLGLSGGAPQIGKALGPILDFTIATISLGAVRRPLQALVGRHGQLSQELAYAR
jgi:hypothetical protein